MAFPVTIQPSKTRPGQPHKPRAKEAKGITAWWEAMIETPEIWLVVGFYQPVVNILLILMVNDDGYYMVNDG